MFRIQTGRNQWTACDFASEKFSPALTFLWFWGHQKSHMSPFVLIKSIWLSHCAKTNTSWIFVHPQILGESHNMYKCMNLNSTKIDSPIHLTHRKKIFVKTKPFVPTSMGGLGTREPRCNDSQEKNTDSENIRFDSASMEPSGPTQTL